MVVRVAGVAPGPGERAVTVTATLGSGAEGCGQDPRVDQVTVEDDAVFANVVADAITGISCPGSDDVDVTLTAPVAIGDRAVVLNQKAYALRADAYQPCPEELGCRPPADPCDAQWTRYAVRNLDVSRHSTGTVEYCDGSWLAMTVPDDPAACGVEARPNCASETTVRRYVMTFTGGEGWHTVEGGCAAAPRQVCEGLTDPGALRTAGPSMPPGAVPTGG